MTKEETDDNGNKIVHPATQEVVVDPKPLKAPHCTVGVDAGMTIPTGSYSNVKIGVFLSIPCDAEEIDEAFEAASDWVSDKLSSMHEDVLKSFE